jgi:hypothetical protein
MTSSIPILISKIETSSTARHERFSIGYGESCVRGEVAAGGCGATRSNPTGVGVKRPHHQCLGDFSGSGGRVTENEPGVSELERDMVTTREHMPPKTILCAYARASLRLSRPSPGFVTHCDNPTVDRSRGHEPNHPETEPLRRGQ